MKSVSADYITSMEQPIRNRSFCKVVLTFSDNSTVEWSDDVSYRDNRLVSVAMNEYNSPIAEELPQTDATVILNNRDFEFDPLLETGISTKLRNGLPITISFGYDISNNGNITWLSPTHLLLDTWQIGEDEVSLTAVDLFSKLVTDEKLCVGEQLSIYDYARLIFEEVGVSYSIDGYTSYMDDPGQDYLIVNPLPYATAGELLQMLANAGHGYLYVDDNGVYHLAKSVALLPDYTATSSGGHELSGDVSDIMDVSVPRIKYSSLSWHFWKADGTSFFAPRSASNKKSNAIWMSSDIAFDLDDTGGESCTIQAPFSVEVTLDAPVNVPQIWVYTGFKRTSDDYGPKDVAIWLYSASDMNNPTVILATQEVGKDYLTVSNPYTDLTKIKVSNLDANGNNVARFDEYARFSIAAITFGEGGAAITRDAIKRSDMYAPPIVSDENRIRSITVSCDDWTSTSNNTSFTGSIVVPANSTYTFTVEHDAIEGGNGIITGASGVTLDSVSCGSFATKFTVTNTNNADTTVNYQRFGELLESVQKSLTVTYDTQGRDLVWHNPLVNFSEAQKMADWIYSFFNGKFDLEFDWRGDPKLQAGDLVSVERIDGAKQVGRIIETETDYAGTLRGRMTVRKVVM